MVSPEGQQLVFDIAVHRGKLIAGQRLETSHMSGSQLKWKELEQSKSLPLPKSGFVEFSPDGTRILVHLAAKDFARFPS